MKFYQIPSTMTLIHDLNLVRLQGTGSGNEQVPVCSEEGGSCGEFLNYYCDNREWIIRMEFSNATCETFNPLSSCNFYTGNDIFSGCVVNLCQDGSDIGSCGASAYYEISCPDNLSVPCGQGQLDFECNGGDCTDYTFIPG